MALETLDITTSANGNDARPAPASPDLLALRDEIRVQGLAIRTTQRAFSIFAVFAFIIAAATCAVVVSRLGPKTTTVAAAAPAAVAAPASAAKPVAAVQSLDVKLSEFVVGMSSTTAAAGKVTFAVHNGGTVPHEFVVLRTDKPASDLMKGARADEAGNVGETGDLAVGASKTLHLNLKPGHYALICNLPGHYQAGQHVDFTVR